MDALSKYLFGVDYQSRDVRLALIQASSRHIGTLSDLVLLYCCSYSPDAGPLYSGHPADSGPGRVASLLAVIGMIWLLSKKPKSAPVGV